MKKLLLTITIMSIGTSLSAQLYINEIMVQPPNSSSSPKQDNEELIEIRGVANSTIAANTYLIQVEGDETDPGDIESSSNNAGGIIDLSGKTIGSNGTLVILTTGHPYTINSGGTTRVTGVTDGNLEDPTHTFFLINTNGNSVTDDGGTSRSAPHSNHDLDENNDGIIDTKFTSAWTFMDGISIIDNDDSNEYGYAEVIFSKNPSNSTIYKSGTATLVDTSGQQFRYFARIGNSTGYNAGEVADADWVGGTINSGDNPNLSSSDYWHFGSNSSGIRALPEAWEGYELNHLGEPNPSSTSSTQLGTTTSTIASDTYTENSLVSGAGSGTGFGNWQIISAVSGFSGYYSSGGTAIGNSYGLWSKESNTSKVRRLFNENLK